MTAVRLFRPRSGCTPIRWPVACWSLTWLSLVLHALLLFGLDRRLAWESAPRPDQARSTCRPGAQAGVNPQAGRPEPRAATLETAGARSAAGGKPKTAATVPKSAVASKATPAGKRPPSPAESHVAGALQNLRDEQALQQRLAALRQSHIAVADRGTGRLPDAKGTEAGVSSLVYVQATIQQNWALSPYLLADPAKMARIEAWVRITLR